MVCTLVEKEHIDDSDALEAPGALRLFTQFYTEYGLYKGFVVPLLYHQQTLEGAVQSGEIENSH